VKIRKNKWVVYNPTDSKQSWEDACYNCVYDVLDKCYWDQGNMTTHDKYNYLITYFDKNIAPIVKGLNSEKIADQNDFDWFMIAATSCSILQDISPEDVRVESIANLLIRKQKDYGPENISKFGLIGICIRLSDKLARLSNLFMKSGSDDFKNILNSSKLNSVPNETVVDTLIDILGYCVVAMMFIRIDPHTKECEFLLPLRGY
jgi:hypothetical protein